MGRSRPIVHPRSCAGTRTARFTPTAIPLEPEQMRAIHYATGRPISMNIEGGVIRSVDALDTDDTDLPIVAPGLVDLQINGYAGHDINSLPLADNALGQMIRAMWREGVTS